MAPIELAPFNHPMPLAQFSISPDRSDPSSPQHAVPLNNFQQIIEMVQDITTKKIKSALVSKYVFHDMQLESPLIQPYLLQNIKDLLLAANDTKSPTPAEIPGHIKQNTIEDHQEVVTQTLKLDEV
jgi:hypothetical protein